VPVTMAERPDIWYAAALMLARHQEEAPEFAARHISRLRAQGNESGVALWGEILAIVGVMRARKSRARPPSMRIRKKRPAVPPAPFA